MNNPEDLNCIICFDIFNEPVTLVCGHSFCKNCIIQSLSQVPKCPLCKYPILGVFDFRVNIVLQKMVDKHRGETGPIPKDSDPEIEDDFKIEGADPTHPNPVAPPLEGRRPEDAVRLPAFEIINNKKYFFKNTLYKIEIVFGLPYDLIAAIIPGNNFVGFVQEKTTHRPKANTFELVSISKPTYKGLEVIARCKDFVIIDEIQVLNLKDSEEFVRQHRLEAVESLMIKYVNCQKFYMDQARLSPQDKSMLKDIHFKVVHFLGVLQTKNPQILEMLKVRLNMAFVHNGINYYFEENLFDYLNFCAALLDLSDSERKAMYDSSDASAMVKVLHNYLKHTTPDNDPIFIFNHTESVPFNKQWLLVLFVAILALAMKLFMD